MKTTQTSGLLLRKGSPEAKTLRQRAETTCLMAGLLYLALSGSLASLCGLSWETAYLLPLTLGLSVCVLRFWLLVKNRDRWFAPVLLASLLLFVLVFREQALSGAILLAQQACKAWTARTGHLFLAPANPSAAGKELLSQAMALGVGAISLAAVCCFTVRKLKTLTAALLSLALLTAVTLLDLSALDPWLIGLAVVCCLLGAVGKDGEAVSAAPMLLAAFLTASFMIFPQLGQTGFIRLREAAEDSLHQLRYGGGTLPRGRLDRLDLTEKADENETELILTMDIPEAISLRGFVGDRFDGRRWTPTDPQTLEENSDLLYWLHADSLYPQTQFERASRLLPGGSVQKVTIQTVNADRAYIYAPYHVRQSSLADELTQLDLAADSIHASGLRGCAQSGYSILTDPTGRLASLLELLQTEADSQPVRDYLAAEGSYRRFVYENDCFVPESFERAFSSRLEELKRETVSSQAFTADQARECVLRFMEDGPKLEDIPESSGTSYEYATLAALALRYYGLPARYVEGYTVTAQDVLEPGRAFAVTQKQAGAWCEVYQDGLGWLPLDAAPGFAALSGQKTEAGMLPAGSGSDGESSLEAVLRGLDDKVLKEGQALEPDREQPEARDSTESADERRENSNRRLQRWPVLLALLALLLAAIYLRRWLILRKREQRFSSEDVSLAVGWLFADAVELLETLKISRGNGSVRSIFGEAGQLFGEDYAKSLERMTDLNGEALFSSHDLGESRRDEMRGFHRETLERLRKSESLPRRLVQQWLLCLY